MAKKQEANAVITITPQAVLLAHTYNNLIRGEGGVDIDDLTVGSALKALDSHDFAIGFRLRKKFNVVVQAGNEDLKFEKDKTEGPFYILAAKVIDQETLATDPSLKTEFERLQTLKDKYYPQESFSVLYLDKQDRVQFLNDHGQSDIVLIDRQGNTLWQAAPDIT